MKNIRLLILAILTLTACSNQGPSTPIDAPANKAIFKQTIEDLRDLKPIVNLSHSSSSSTSNTSADFKNKYLVSLPNKQGALQPAIELKYNFKKTSNSPITLSFNAPWLTHKKLQPVFCSILEKQLTLNKNLEIYISLIQDKKKPIKKISSSKLYHKSHTIVANIINRLSDVKAISIPSSGGGQGDSFSINSQRLNGTSYQTATLEVREGHNIKLPKTLDIHLKKDLQGHVILSFSKGWINNKHILPTFCKALNQIMEINFGHDLQIKFYDDALKAENALPAFFGAPKSDPKN